MTTPTPTKLALIVVEMARAGRFAEIRELFSPTLRPMVTPAVLQTAWEHELGEKGEITAIGEARSEPSGPVAVVRVLISCEHGSLTLVASVAGDGLLAGVELAGPEASEPETWGPPGYVDPARFVEEEVTVGDGPHAVPGTLSCHRCPGPHLAVVLLGGSGPLDRDETVGRNRPLEDLAWGLVSRGVAVLRFDKATFSHPDEVREAPSFTLEDEYVSHATAAVELLRHRRAIDPDALFLLGHSLGGTVAPRAAASSGSVGGLVILAGDAQPLQWAIVRQTRYLAGPQPDQATASKPAIAALVEQARRVDSDELCTSTPSSDLPLGVPAPYWLDLRSYEPVAVAASLECSILLLQRGRNYQASVDDNLVRWQTGLAGHPDVTVRVYPADNHLIFSGSGPSSPVEYEPAQHVDEALVADIAAWLAAHAASPHGRAS